MNFLHRRTSAHKVTTLQRPILYYTPDSPPCQAVILVIKQLHLNIQLKDVDFDKSEHMSPEFRKMNPLHQVPTLDDNGFFISDSHAIISYMAAGSHLTSTDSRLLARINEMLCFDFELFRVMGEVGIPMFYEGAAEPSQKALKILDEKLSALEYYLKQRKWVSGEFLTIADFSVLATFSVIYHCPIDLSKYQATLEWFARCKKASVGYDDIEEDSKNALGNFLKSKGIELKLKS
ncbi:CLUMA_CG010889, isoform A [Clunio marinus]|uniref:glutathione transferase n=1 Tax=Clunio marinus TaxID=568069 RepID=A0A1J1ID69_9DIPT|nr:CLUMA_CG010889, isoform A [Clunio marinus]